MIHDTLKNAGLYAGVSPVVAQAFEFIAAHDWAHMAPGRYPIRENAAYLNYTTGPLKNWAETPFKAHKDYLDIHVVLQGAEIIGHTDTAKLQPQTEYDPASDIYFLNGEGDPITLHAGQFMLVFPHDAHKPLIRPDFYDGPSVKLVVKIRMDAL